MLRQDTLCKGGERQERGCSMATTMRCADCGREYEPASGDPDFTEDCPGCGSELVSVMRCESCPILSIDYVRQTTNAGRLLERVLDLDFATKRFKVDIEQVTAEEMTGLKVLEQERWKWERERTERQQQQAAIEARKQEAQRRARERAGRYGGV